MRKSKEQRALAPQSSSPAMSEVTMDSLASLLGLTASDAIVGWGGSGEVSGSSPETPNLPSAPFARKPRPTAPQGHPERGTFHLCCMECIILTCIGAIDREIASQNIVRLVSATSRACVCVFVDGWNLPASRRCSDSAEGWIFDEQGIDSPKRCDPLLCK